MSRPDRAGQGWAADTGDPALEERPVLPRAIVDRAAVRREAGVMMVIDRRPGYVEREGQARTRVAPVDPS